MRSHNHKAVATLVLFNLLLGFGWYSVFLKPWMDGFGDLAQQMDPADPIPFIASIISAVLMTYALSWLLFVTKTQTLKRAAEVGFIVWVGFGAPSLVPYMAFGGVGWASTWVNAGELFVLIEASCMVLWLWQSKARKNQLSVEAKP